MEPLRKLLIMSSYLWMFMLIFIKPAKMIIDIPEPYRFMNSGRCRNNYPINYTTNFKTAPGMVNQTTIRSRCINGGLEMELTWRRPERSHLVEYYVIEMSPRIYGYYVNPCLRSNSSEPVFIFDAKTRKDQYFLTGVNFYIRIHTYPLTPYLDSEAQNVGGCPTSGIWSAWGNWSQCKCNSDCVSKGNRTICAGHKSRSRICVYAHKPESKCADVNCRDNGYMGESKDAYAMTNCENECVEPTKKTENIDGGDDDDDDSKNLIIIILIIIIFIILIIAVLIFLRFRSKKKASKQKDLLLIEERPTVYISYSASNETQEMAILKLANGLNKHGIRVIVDLLNTVEINSMGGLPSWLPDNISSADKVIVMLSKEYIKALSTDEKSQEEEQNSDRVCKVHTEFKFINTMLYKNCQKSPKIALVLEDGIRKDDIPSVFRAMHHCPYPNKFDQSSDAFTTLLGILLDTEPIQIESAQIVEVTEETKFDIA